MRFSSVVPVMLMVVSAQALNAQGTRETTTNAEILRVLQIYRNSGKFNETAAAELRRIAEDRQNRLANLMLTNPATVLAEALPDDILSSFPENVKNLVEQRVHLHGVLQVAVEDGDDYSNVHYSITADGRQFGLHFADANPENLLTGDTVDVEGVQIGNELALSSSATTASSTLTNSTVSGYTVTTLPNTFGAQPTLVMLVNFQDLATQPFTAATAQSMFFTTASNFWLENSYQQTYITGDVSGWYTLPISSTTCDMNSIQTYAQQAAQNAGYVLTNYKHFVYAFPKISACTWAGYSYIGGTPSNTWLNGSMQQYVVSHELGHSLGLNHSHSLSCGSVVYATSGCTQYEYGDYYDTMANSNTNGYSMDYNAFQRERLGWLGYSGQPPITTVSASGTYTISPSEMQDSNVKALKIPQSSVAGSYYYVEFRQATGFDNYLSLNVSGYSNVLNGVVVHSANPSTGNSSNLLNMNPTSSWGSAMALDAGQSYTDSTAGVTIAVTGVSANNSATVAVTFGPVVCTPANPSVAITGPSSSVAPGATATFSIKVTDNDSAGCSAVNFGLSALAPAGWIAVYSASSVSLSPGGSSTLTLSVTAPTSASSGTYTVTATAGNLAATSYSGSASASETISAPVCTPANPTVTVTGPGSSVASGSTASFTVKVIDNDSSACSAANFGLTSVAPTGWSAAYDVASANLSPGGSATVTLSVTAPSSASSGTYTITATAGNLAASTYTGSGSATETISAPVCTPANPTVSVTGPSSSVAPGATASFNVKVTDNDSAGCSATSFGLTSVVPTGWSAAYNVAAANLSPGGTSMVTLSVAAPSSASSGTYTIIATAGNLAASTYTGSGSATETVSAPVCTPTNPTVSVTGPSSSVAPGATASFNVKVTDNDSAGCSAASFGLTSLVPSGWNAVYNAGSVSLSPGGSSNVTLSVTSSSSAPNGTYTITAMAGNLAASGYSGSGSASETVSAPLTFTVSVSTSAPSYSLGQTVSVSTTVMSGTVAASGVAVAMNLIKPNGSSMSMTGTTGANGVVLFTYKTKRNDPVGTWTAAGSAQGRTANASFVVK